MKNFFLALCCGVALLACNKPKEEAATTVAAAPPPQSEIGDPKFAVIGKQGLDQLANGDIDGWMNAFSDNAKYYFSGGDSLVGKAAIGAYWKDRRTNVIDKLSYQNDIWTPLKVNRPQKGPDQAGNWLLGWYIVTATYKNGQSMTQWIHTDYHFDANDKVDVVVQYIDRAPINAALAKKK